VIPSRNLTHVPASDFEERAEPTREWIGARVIVDDHSSQRAKPSRTGEVDRLMVACFVEFGVTDQDHYPWLGQAEGSQSEHHADAEPEAVAERSARDLDARDEHVVRVITEPSIEVAEAVELADRDEALGCQHRVIGHRPVPLRKQEPIPGGIVRGRWRHAEDAVVEDPQNVEGGMRARAVLLVAGEPAQKRRQVAVTESCSAHSPGGYNFKLT
jgi:hypothetical protein